MKYTYFVSFASKISGDKLFGFGYSEITMSREIKSMRDIVEIEKLAKDSTGADDVSIISYQLLNTSEE